jgi:hypothetical protein
MATTIKSSDLDFDNIKASLKQYLSAKDEFEDYDFEGSALSNILDVLAYNTHINGLVANFALNETFLPTAQLRTSLVNHSLAFGYIPRSKTSSRATLNISVNLQSAAVKPETITLPAGWAFTSTVEGVEYTFRTLIDYIGYDTTGSGIYTFVDPLGTPAVTVLEGAVTVKTFIAEPGTDRQVYVVPDQNLDLSTVAVQVYDDINSDTFTSYFSANATSGGQVISSIDENTALYLPLETYNGYWEFNFAIGGLTGNNPQEGQVIRVTYLKTNGKNANGASTFTPSFPNLTINNVSYPLSISTTAKSAFGADKETTESIRVNAPLSYLAQNRLVAPSDYRGVIANGVPGIKSINAWGGEDNIPAKYGKTMVSIVYEDTLTPAQIAGVEQAIKSNLTDPLSVVGVEAEFVQPTFQYINCSTSFKYDVSATNLTAEGINSKVKNAIGAYFGNNTGKFNDLIRKSRLQTIVDATDASILGNNISLTMSSRFIPLKNTAGSFVRSAYEISFLNSLASPLMTADESIITSSRFVYNSKVCTIRNAPLHSTKLQIIDIDQNVLVDNTGSYNPTTGIINLTGFLPESILSGDNFISINAIPKDDSVFKPLRNTLITIGSNSASGIPDTNQATNTVGVTN